MSWLVTGSIVVAVVSVVVVVLIWFDSYRRRTR